MTKVYPTQYSIVTHNVHSFNSPIKRNKAFQFYHSQRADVLLLQETHFSKTSAPRYLNTKYPQFYLSSGPDKKGGVAVCFSMRTPFTPITIVKDKIGRYIMAVGHLHD